MHNKVLYSAVFDGSYPFSELFDKVTTVTEVEELVELDSALIIWGGGDISPTFYGHGVSKLCRANKNPSNRDIVEWSLALSAVELGIPVIGICRGAQIMCAMSGGYLIQDVTGHGRSHQMEVINTKEIMVASSLHHQMMFPWGVEHTMIAKSFPAISSHYITRADNEKDDLEIETLPCEPEIVWFPKTKALAIQGHPEFVGVESRYVQYCIELINDYIFV